MTYTVMKQTSTLLRKKEMYENDDNPHEKLKALKLIQRLIQSF